MVSKDPREVVKIWKRNNQNRRNGSGWEGIIQRRAFMSGMLAKKVGLSAILNGKTAVPVRSFLDFQIISRDGRVAFLDAKCWEKAYFTYSDINVVQLDRALEYNKWNVPAGFLCLFRKSNEVAYFPGSWIASRGPRTRFNPGDGIELGQLMDFDLNLIFQGSETESDACD
jgi:hypothetical protein